MRGRKTGGRRPNTPNKVTRAVREVIQLALDGSGHLVADWLLAAGRDDPAKALDLYIKLAEFAVPKLTRAEVRVKTEPTEIAVPLTPEEVNSAYLKFLKGELLDVQIVTPALPAPVAVIDGLAIEPDEDE